MWLDRARFADWLKGLASFSITFGLALFAWSDTPASMALQGGIEELVRFGAVLLLLRRPGSPLRTALPFGLGWASGEAAAAMWLARDMFFAGTLSGYAIPANANEAKHLFMLTQWVTLLPAHVALQGILHTALTVWAVVFARNVKRLDLFLGALFLKVAGNAAILAATSPFGEDIARFA